MNDVFETFLTTAYPSADGGIVWKILVAIGLVCGVIWIITKIIVHRYGPWYKLPQYMWNNDIGALAVIGFFVFVIAGFAVKDWQEHRSRIDQFLNDKDNQGLVEFHEKIDKDFLNRKEELINEKGETK